MDKRSTTAFGGSDADLFSQTLVVLDEDFDDPQQSSEGERNDDEKTTLKRFLFLTKVILTLSDVVFHIRL